MKKRTNGLFKALSFTLAFSLVISAFSLLGSMSALADAVPGKQLEDFENGLNQYSGSSQFSLYTAQEEFDENVYSGISSLKNAGTSTNHTWYCNSALTVEAGKRYAVSFWYKGGNAAATSIALSFFNDQSANGWLNGTAGEWKYYSKFITATEANSQLHFGIMVYANSGEMYFDDIRVEEISSSAYVDDFSCGYELHNLSNFNSSIVEAIDNTYLNMTATGGNASINLPIWLDSTKTYTISFKYRSSAWFCWYNGSAQYGLNNTEWATTTKTGIAGSDNYIKFYAANGVSIDIDDISIKEELTASVEAVTGGVANVSATKLLYGDSVTYSIVEDEGYTFLNWQNAAGAAVSTSATYTFNITENTVLTPIFDEVSGYNCVALSQDDVKGTAAVNKSLVYGNGTATFTAAAADGYEFSKWIDISGKTVSSLNPYRVTVNEDVTLTAVFDTAQSGVQKESFESNPTVTGPFNGGSGSYSIYNSYDQNGNEGYVSSGYSSLLISRSSGNYGIRINTISFKAGKTYSISFKYRNTDDATGAWFYIIGNSNYSANASTNWQTYTRQVTFENAVDYMSIATTTCTGLLIDDILVREVNVYNQAQGFEYGDASISNIGDDTNGNGKSEIYTAQTEDYDNQNVAGGNNSLKVVHSTGNARNLRTRIYGFTLTAGKTYNLTFSYKNPENAVWFYAVDSTTAPISSNQSSEWKTYTIDFTPINSSNSIDFGTTTDSAVLYIDDIVLREKSDYSVSVNKESARIDYINTTAEKIFVSDTLGFTVKQTNSEDTVTVKVNNVTASPDENGVYSALIDEIMTVDINISGSYSDTLPAAGRGINGEILDAYDANVAMQEIWYGDTVYHESVFFYDCFDDVSGTQVTRNTANLLYPASTVISLRSYDMKTYYVLGVDYNIVDGKIVLTEDSAIPVYTEKLTAPRELEDENTDITVNAGDTSYADYYYIDDTYGLKLISKDGVHNNHSVLVTYTHTATWDEQGVEGYTPAAVKAQGSELNNLYSKLDGVSSEDVNVLVYGASSATGSSSSANGMSYVLFDKDGNGFNYKGKEPYSPTYFEQAIGALVDEYGNGNDINYYNIALGGTNSAWGLANLDTRIGYLNSYYQGLNNDSSWSVSPDVIIVAFNGNDFLTEASQFEANITGIVERFKTLYPNADIILPSEKMNNTACYMYTEEKALEMQATLENIADAYDGVVAAGVSSVFAEIIDSKLPVDYLSNNINHGNDFYARVFAQTIFNTIERHVLGDTNGDGQVNIIDLVRFKKYMANPQGIDFNIKTYNTTLDNKVDSADLVALRRILLVK